MHPDLTEHMNSCVAEEHLQAIHDPKRDFHMTFQLVIPSEESPETAPLSVAVVSKDGEVYGPYQVTGLPGDQSELVFQVLKKLLN